MSATAAANILAVDTADPYQREAQIFPKLDAEMVDRVSRYGASEAVAAGTALYKRGQRAADFFLILRGSVVTFDETSSQERRIFARQSSRQFTGETNLLNGRETLVTTEADADSEVIRIERRAFRKMLAAEPDIAEIVMRAFILRRVGFIRHGHGGVTLVGSTHDSDTVRIQRFLTRNGYPNTLVAADVDLQSSAVMRGFGLSPADLPAVIAPGPILMVNPRNHELADRLGMTEPLDEDFVFDVAVVGAGPAGLAAAVYAASEGLSTIVVEQEAPGGQAGTSSKIENYLGFPTGISGQALAGRAQAQAQKFGAHLAISRAASGLDCTASPYRIELEDGARVRAGAIVVATGARYRKLELPNYERLEGQGIYYAATGIESRLCEHEEVVVVGGGNSAGQAAMFLSRTASHVHVLVRGSGLAATMSDYLVQRILTSPRITLHAHVEVVGLDGDTFLSEVTWQERTSGERTRRRIGALFVMIGAEPNTEWLGGCLNLDRSGFVETGSDEGGKALASSYATTKPGIFAIGDVRSGSVKRVATGVGEGSAVIQAVHRFLQADVA